MDTSAEIDQLNEQVMQLRKDNDNLEAKMKKLRESKKKEEDLKDLNNDKLKSMYSHSKRLNLMRSLILHHILKPMHSKTKRDHLR